MRFRRTSRPEPYRNTSRKRAAFARKQRLERECGSASKRDSSTKAKIARCYHYQNRGKVGVPVRSLSAAYRPCGDHDRHNDCQHPERLV